MLIRGLWLPAKSPLRASIPRLPPGSERAAARRVLGGLASVPTVVTLTIARPWRETWARALPAAVPAPGSPEAVKSHAVHPSRWGFQADRACCGPGEAPARTGRSLRFAQGSETGPRDCAVPALPTPSVDGVCVCTHLHAVSRGSCPRACRDWSADKRRDVPYLLSKSKRRVLRKPDSLLDVRVRALLSLGPRWAGGVVFSSRGQPLMPPHQARAWPSPGGRSRLAGGQSRAGLVHRRGHGGGASAGCRGGHPSPCRSPLRRPGTQFLPRPLRRCAETGRKGRSPRVSQRLKDEGGRAPFSWGQGPASMVLGICIHCEAQACGLWGRGPAPPSEDPGLPAGLKFGGQQVKTQALDTPSACCCGHVQLPPF